MIIFMNVFLVVTLAIVAMKIYFWEFNKNCPSTHYF
jgi:hypothetical protein